MRKTLFIGLSVLLTAATASAQTITATFQWAREASADETAFLVQRNTDGGPFRNVGRAARGVLTFNDPTLQANHTYCYQVRAINPYGTSGPSDQVCVSTWCHGPPKPAKMDEED